ncbi:MAG: magnesium transporter CorA family protein [Hyphomicrobiaceae bacterium]|nr:magnesium transporter CorA family protein [Hyphomicrobiaceae bacterium]
MIHIYDSIAGKLTKREGLVPILELTAWIDLINPTAEEDQHLQQQLGVEIPTRAEAREIEASNRVYQEKGASYMTAYVMFNIEQPNPGTSNVTFILAGNRLVTVRYVEPKAFPFFLSRVERGEATCTCGPSIMIGILESMLHRTADLIERIQDDVDGMARELFEINGARRKHRESFAVYLRGTGRDADIVARAQESAVSIERVLAYFATMARERSDDPAVLGRIASAKSDIVSLNENMKFLQGRTSFLLDATLGMISTEQNQIIKLFSVMAVMLMPPTLIASIYGMNFKHMPELEWVYGYPTAVALMILAGIIPFFYFRAKGWL